MSINSIVKSKLVPLIKSKQASHIIIIEWVVEWSDSMMTLDPVVTDLSLSLSLSVPLLFVGLIYYVCGRFSTPFLFIILGVGLPAYLSNHNLLSREHIFVGFNEFSSLVYWCSVIHHHRPQGPTLFRRVRWDFTCVQCYVCTYTGPPVLSPIRED